MHKVIIVGAGELGSRHLQGLLQSKVALNIVVVDTSSKSIDTSIARAKEVVLGNEGTDVSFVTTIPKKQRIELAIIATNATVRFDVFKSLVAANDVRKIIFEKVLFQKEDDFISAKKMLTEKGIDAWVNCPRRMFSAYQNIKVMLESESNITMNVSGAGWGLACNGIHFIDLFAFLTEESKFSISGERLTNKIEESKRAGFYEVFGVITGEGEGAAFELSCADEGAMSVKVNITTPNLKIEILELEGKVNVLSAAGAQQLAYEPRYQSQLTNLYAEQILKGGHCLLTSFDESSLLHIPFLSSIKTHIEAHKEVSLDHCPIT